MAKAFHMKIAFENEVHQLISLIYIGVLSVFCVGLDMKVFYECVQRNLHTFCMIGSYFYVYGCLGDILLYETDLTRSVK